MISIAHRSQLLGITTILATNRHTIRAAITILFSACFLYRTRSSFRSTICAALGIQRNKLHLQFKSTIFQILTSIMMRYHNHHARYPQRQHTYSYYDFVPYGERKPEANYETRYTHNYSFWPQWGNTTYTSSTQVPVAPKVGYKVEKKKYQFGYEQRWQDNFKRVVSERISRPPGITRDSFWDNHDPYGRTSSRGRNTRALPDEYYDSDASNKNEEFVELADQFDRITIGGDLWDPKIDPPPRSHGWIQPKKMKKSGNYAESFQTPNHFEDRQSKANLRSNRTKNIYDMLDDDDDDGSEYQYSDVSLNSQTDVTTEKEKKDEPAESPTTPLAIDDWDENHDDGLKVAIEDEKKHEHDGQRKPRHPSPNPADDSDGDSDDDIYGPSYMGYTHNTINSRIYTPAFKCNPDHKLHYKLRNCTEIYGAIHAAQQHQDLVNCFDAYGNLPIAMIPMRYMKLGQHSRVLVESLFGNGTYLCHQNAKGINAWHRCFMEGDQEVRDSIHQCILHRISLQNVEETLLFLARVHKLSWMFEAQRPLSTRFDFRRGMFALHIIVESMPWSIESMVYLLNLDPSTLEAQGGRRRRTPLHLLFLSGSVDGKVADVVEPMLAHCGNGVLGIRDKDGMTPLMIAASRFSTPLDLVYRLFRLDPCRQMRKRSNA